MKKLHLYYEINLKKKKELQILKELFFFDLNVSAASHSRNRFVQQSSTNSKPDLGDVNMVILSPCMFLGKLLCHYNVHKC